MTSRPITKADQANAMRRALQRARSKFRITEGQRRTIVNNVTVTVAPQKIKAILDDVAREWGMT